MNKKLLAATAALSLLLALAAGCGKQNSPAPTTVPTAAPTEPATTPTEPATQPTAPDASQETMKVYNHKGLQYRLAEDFTVEETDESVKFHRDHIQGTIQFGTQQQILGTTVASSLEAAQYLKGKLAPDNENTVIGSSTGVCYYLAIPGTDKTQALGVYISGDNCWKLTAESPNAIDQDYLIRIVGRCAMVSASES